jgi:hypothetical protein
VTIDRGSAATAPGSGGASSAMTRPGKIKGVRIERSHTDLDIGFSFST